MLVHKSLESMVRKSREGLIWVELSGVGRRMIVRVVYVNLERMRVREMARLVEVLQVDVKYEEKVFDVIVMWISMQELDWEQRNIMGKLLVRAGNLSIGNQLQCCDGGWTWVSCVRSL